MTQLHPNAPQVVDPVERDINDTIDRLIRLLNVRRAELLDVVREKRAAEVLRGKIINELTAVQEQLHLDLRQNILQPLKNKMILKLECTKHETILNTPVESRSELKCNTHELERSISLLGEIVEVPVNVPRYTTCHTSVVATAKKGRATGELYYPYGVAIHKETHQIFVVNQFNHRVEIFSETGEFFSQLGVGQLSHPWGIAIHGDSLYVSCKYDHTISQFSLIEMLRVRRIGGEGSNNGQFYSPSHLTTDLIGCVLIADTLNSRICIHDPDLNHLRNIEHQLMSLPYDVKVSGDRLYVLCPRSNPCIIVLTLEGFKLHSRITCGEGMNVLRPLFFCLDPLNNFVLSDWGSHSIRIFSPEGNLLYTIGRKGNQPGMFSYPRGVAITPNERLVCVSENENSGLQIF